MSADDASSNVEPVRVAVVTIATTTTTQNVVAELRRSAIHVDVLAVDVLHAPAALPVYVISVDPTMARLLADKIVAWAASSELRPGLIGIVEDGSVRDAEELLAAGFDDVVSGAVSPRELVVRVRAVHRRVYWQGNPHGRLRFGDVTLDVYGRALWVDGKTIALTSIELAVMRELLRARGRPLSRIDLLDRAWGDGELEVSERAVDNVILRIRRKLPRPDLVETVRGVGFRLAG